MSKPVSRRRRLSKLWPKLLLAAVAMTAPRAAFAWGQEGHKIVADIAEKQLSHCLETADAHAWPGNNGSSSRPEGLDVGPAFQAGLSIGTSIVAVDGTAFDADRLRAAIRAATGGKTPIHLLVKDGSRYRDLPIAWTGGLRYPRLERVGSGASTLDALLAPK